MHYQVWETDGHYIMGKKVGGICKTLKTANKRAKDVTGFATMNNYRVEDNVLLYIENAQGIPIGLIEKIPAKEKE